MLLRTSLPLFPKSNDPSLPSIPRGRLQGLCSRWLVSLHRVMTGSVYYKWYYCLFVKSVVQVEMLVCELWEYGIDGNISKFTPWRQSNKYWSIPQIIHDIWNIKYPDKKKVLQPLRRLPLEGEIVTHWPGSDNGWSPRDIWWDTKCSPPCRPIAMMERMTLF